MSKDMFSNSSQKPSVIILQEVAADNREAPPEIVVGLRVVWGRLDAAGVVIRPDGAVQVVNKLLVSFLIPSTQCFGPEESKMLSGQVEPVLRHYIATSRSSRFALCEPEPVVRTTGSLLEVHTFVQGVCQPILVSIAEVMENLPRVEGLHLATPWRMAIATALAGAKEGAHVRR